MSILQVNDVVKTDDFYLAAYLITIGYPILRVEPREDRPQIKMFVFEGKNSIDESIRKYTLSNPLIHIHNIVVALRRLKTMMYSTNGLDKKGASNKKESPTGTGTGGVESVVPDKAVGEVQIPK